MPARYSYVAVLSLALLVVAGRIYLHAGSDRMLTAQTIDPSAQGACCMEYDQACLQNITYANCKAKGNFFVVSNNENDCNAVCYPESSMQSSRSRSSGQGSSGAGTSSSSHSDSSGNASSGHSSSGGGSSGSAASTSSDSSAASNASASSYSSAGTASSASSEEYSSGEVCAPNRVYTCCHAGDFTVIDPCDPHFMSTGGSGQLLQGPFSQCQQAGGTVRTDRQGPISPYYVSTWLTPDFDACTTSSSSSSAISSHAASNSSRFASSSSNHYSSGASSANSSHSNRHPPAGRAGLATVAIMAASAAAGFACIWMRRRKNQDGKQKEG